MRKLANGIICLLAICQLSAITAFAQPEWPQGLEIGAEAGIVIDADSGAVLYEKNAHTAYPPASITKLLTAMIVLEHSPVDDMVTFSEDSVMNVEAGSGNKLAVEPGDRLSVEDCLYSLLLHSCNQAANALAEHVAGNRDAFVQMMNERIKEIGCGESHFDNPSGLNGDTQYVTAYDMALIAQAAYRNPKLVEINSALSRKIGPTANYPEGQTIYAEHRLLKTDDPNSPYYYPAAVAGKTGYLLKAGNTLVTYAVQGDRRLISVVLKGKPRQYFVDGKVMLQFGYDHFQNYHAAGLETAYVSGEELVEIGGSMYHPSDLEIDPSGTVTLPVGASFADAQQTLKTDLPKDHPPQAVGVIRYTYGGRPAGMAYLIAKKESQVLPVSADEVEKEAEEAATGEQGAFPAIALAIGGGAVLLGAGAAGYVIYSHKREARELERRREERRIRLGEEGTKDAFEQMLMERKSSARKSYGSSRRPNSKKGRLR